MPAWTASTRTTSSVAYAVDEMASDAKIGRAIRLREALVPLLGRGDRTTDQDPLGERHHTERSTRRRRGAAPVACGAVGTAALVHSRSVHVVIVGCGRVGSSLARDLTTDGHTVAIIDRRSDVVQPARSRLRRPHRAGHRLRPRPPRSRPGIEEAGALAAVTSGDNSNILVARVARENFGIEQVVARIYDPRRAVIYQRLGIMTVATVAWTTDQVAAPAASRRPGRPSGPTRRRRSASSTGRWPTAGPGTR